MDRVSRVPDRSDGSRVMFVPSAYWNDTDTNFTFASQYHVANYCYNGSADAGCAPLAAADIDAFEAAMQRCFQVAIDLGLDIALAPHLNDGSRGGRWRNGLLFRPEDKKAGFSYADAVLMPLVRALSAVIKPTTNVWFGMMGEMGATVFYYPTEWLAMAGTIKAAFQDNPNVRVGVSTNFDKLCHCLHADLVDTRDYLRQFTRDFHTVKDAFDVPAIINLYSSIDFFAFSSYPSLAPDFQPFQVQLAADQFVAEAAVFGIDIPAIITGGTELWFAEYGLGGGVSQDGDEPARTAEDAANSPYFTVRGNITDSNNPWLVPEVRAYRYFFLSQTLRFLSGDAPGAKYKVSGVFGWNLGLYDFQGISKDNEAHTDWTMINMVKRHNAMIRARAEPA